MKWDVGMVMYQNLLGQSRDARRHFPSYKERNVGMAQTLSSNMPAQGGGGGGGEGEGRRKGCDNAA